MNGTIRQISVLVADAQPLFSEALAGALTASPGLCLFHERPKTGLDTVDAVRALKPDVAVIDYWMPEIEGPAITRLIRARDPARKIILIAWFDGPLEVEASKKAGAGFMSKSTGIDDLRKVVESAGKKTHTNEVNSAYIDDEHAETWMRLERLSRRQIEIIGLASMGLSVPIIGQNLKISPATVKVHLRNILAKSGAGSKREVVAMARAVGLIRN